MILDRLIGSSATNPYHAACTKSVVGATVASAYNTLLATEVDPSKLCDGVVISLRTSIPQFMHDFIWSYPSAPPIRVSMNANGGPHSRLKTDAHSLNTTRPMMTIRLCIVGPQSNQANNMGLV
jgi:hypothetical protein